MTSLGSIPALRTLSAAALQTVTLDSHPARFGAGAMIRPAGERANAAVLLLTGTVVAVHAGPTGREVWPQQWVGPAIADKPAVLDGGTASTGLLAATAVAVRLLPA